MTVKKDRGKSINENYHNFRLILTIVAVIFNFTDKLRSFLYIFYIFC